MKTPRKNKVVRSWVNEHVNDHYVSMAQRDNYRSRAAYKLQQINLHYNIFNKIKLAVDLGSAPGSWLQVLLRFAVGAKIIGVDLLPIQPLEGVEFICGDFTVDAVLDQLVTSINNQPVDLVLSDMAPNLSGIKGVDQARSAYLAELVLDFAQKYLINGGNCVIKVFQGEEFTRIVGLMRQIFTQVKIYKPEASRSKSAETYLVGIHKSY